MGYRVVDHQARVGEKWGSRVITGLGGMTARKQQLYQWRCDVCGSQGYSKYWHLKKTARCPSCPRPHFRKKPFEALYNNFVSLSKKRCLSVEMTYEEFLHFTSILNCHYCGEPVHWAKCSTAGRAYNLDRIDNDKGYSLGNCVVACCRCNMSRGNRFSYHEWLLMTAPLRMARECLFIGIAE